MIPLKKTIVLVAALAMLCICFTACRTQKDNDPSNGRTEPSSVPSSDSTDTVTDPSTRVTLPEETEFTNPSNPTEPSGNGGNIGNDGGQNISGGNQNEMPSTGDSSGNQTPTDPTTPPTTEAPVPPTTTDFVPETSGPAENETEPTEDDEEEDRIELPMVTWPSGN